MLWSITELLVYIDQGQSDRGNCSQGSTSTDWMNDNDGDDDNDDDDDDDNDD